jgi:acyl-CoA thioester hydrolase
LMNSAVDVRYRKPAKYGDTVRVTCWIDKLASRALHFAYEVHRGDTLLVTGGTQHVWINTESNRPCRPPEHLREPFRQLAGLQP